METDYELINTTIYDPSKKLFKGRGNDRAELTKFYCKEKNRCELYKSSHCINVGNMFSCSCIYGKKIIESGYTKRARKFYSWISDRKKKYEDIMYKLNGNPNKLSVIGDFIFLPYAHMSMNQGIEFEGHSSFFVAGKPFINKNIFTIEVIKKLINYRPHAMMGGEIRSYQKEQVPKFVKDLQDSMPALYGQLVEKYPEVAEIAEEYSYIGRKALIHSLKPGVRIEVKKGFGQGVYLWDGEYLISSNYKHSFPLVKYSEIELKIKPLTGEHLVITDDIQVDNDTVFID